MRIPFPREQIRWYITFIMAFLIPELALLVFGDSSFHRAIYFLGFAVTLTLHSDRGREQASFSSYRYSTLRVIYLISETIRKLLDFIHVKFSAERSISAVVIALPFQIAMGDWNFSYAVVGSLFIEVIFYFKPRIMALKN